MITSLSLRHLTRLSRLEIRKLTLAGNFARASSMAFTLISNMRTVFLQQPSYSLLFPVTFMRRFISRFNPRQIRLQTFPCRCWAGHVRKQRQEVAFQVAEPLAPGCRLALGFHCEDDAESGAAMQAGSVFRSRRLLDQDDGRAVLADRAADVGGVRRRVVEERCRGGGLRVERAGVVGDCA